MTIILVGLLLVMTGMIASIHYSDSLVFAIENHGNDNHTIEVKIFNDDSDMIFAETYLSGPSTGIYVPISASALGSYKYIVTMDNKITKEQNVHRSFPRHLTVEIYDENSTRSDETLRLKYSFA
ncbi:hypothetical protein [Methanococcoides burtonii]|nr:hypothetical protein [Methanococcoides burtonii]